MMNKVAFMIGTLHPVGNKKNIAYPFVTQYVNCMYSKLLRNV